MCYSTVLGLMGLCQAPSRHQISHHLQYNGSMQVVTERAAAVIGNLSTSRDYFSSIRESGALQRLVALLDAGSTSRVTEIAAKTLANLSIDDNSRKGIRLAGGVPPLMRLLLEKPSEQASLCRLPSILALSIRMCPCVPLTWYAARVTCLLCPAHLGEGGEGRGGARSC